MVFEPLTKLIYFLQLFISLTLTSICIKLSKKEDHKLESLKKKYKGVRDEQNKLFPELCKKREAYHKLRNLVEAYDNDNEETLETTTYESLNQEDLAVANNKEVKILSLLNNTKK